MNTRSALSHAPLALLCWAACWAMVGCATFGRGCAGGGIGTGGIDVPKPPPLHASDGWQFLNYLGFICIAGGIGILIASAFVPILPRKAAGTAIFCGIGCVLLRHFLEKFEGPILWGVFALLIIGGLCLIYPLAVAAHRGTLLAEAKKLLGKGHVAEAVAMNVAALPHKFKTAESRKALLASLTPGVST